MSGWRPGDRRERVNAMIRVDQAGEFGATRIYAGQLAVLGDRSPAARAIAGMAAQEERHRAWFDAEMAKRGVRPTLLQPFWSVAGFALGAVTAAIGPEAAMACTAAVETEIDRHYEDQRRQLAGGSEPELAARRRRVPGRGAGASRSRPVGGGGTGARLSAAVGGDPARLQGGDRGGEAGLMGGGRCGITQSRRNVRLSRARAGGMS